MANLTITPELLRKLLRYEPETGKLFWRERTPDMFICKSHTPEHSSAKWNSRHAGNEAFTADDGNGYRQGRIFHRAYRAHVIIWALHYGMWPASSIDHINGDPTDNRIENLREASCRDNARNKKIPIDNKSGVVGVSWCNRRGKWQAYINDNAGRRGLGVFVKKSDAIDARRLAEKRLGYHENHGRPGVEVLNG